MSTAVTPAAENNPARGIAFILAGMFCISLNDMLIKQLSGDYPLHQMVFVRSAIGITFSMIFVQLEGGFAILKTNRPGLHLLRGILIVIANMAFFTALAVMPLADATALFFIGGVRLVAVVLGPQLQNYLWLTVERYYFSEWLARPGVITRNFYGTFLRR